jgi:DNA polymerase III alpha subunit
MRLDKYSNPIFNEQDLFDALYQGHSKVISDLPIFVERTQTNLQFESFINGEFLDPNESWSIREYDSAMQSDWCMPAEYKLLDIESWLYEQCPSVNHVRITEELAAYKERNMLDLLRWLKYFVDICATNEVVWGVGRGSSVASYVLYLIGVHSIDSVKYNLDWQEFLR